jgi:hypothetical protein
MTTDRETAEAIRSWLKEEVRLDDAGIHRALARLPDTPQRRHRWLWAFGWRPSAFGPIRRPEGRRSCSTDQQLGLVPATTNRTTTATGRTRLMLSPVKAIIAGALVFALGGAYLIAQPFGQPAGDGLSGAEVTTQTEAVVVTVTQECNTLARLITCEFTANDPRVTGSGGHVFAQTITAQEQFGVPGTELGVYVLDAWINGPDGVWTGHSYLVGNTGTGPVNALMMLTGEGAYDGWSLVAFGTDPEADANHELTGLMYRGSLPPVGSIRVPVGG